MGAIKLTNTAKAIIDAAVQNYRSRFHADINLYTVDSLSGLSHTVRIRIRYVVPRWGNINSESVMVLSCKDDVKFRELFRLAKEYFDAALLKEPA